MSNQEIQSTRSGTSELVGQGIKLLQSGLIPLPKEQIDISLILLQKSLHGECLWWGHLYLFCLEDQI